MSSEKTASAVNILKGDLAAGWNLLEGSSADYTDLGIARRFGGAAAAYSLRDIGAMNGPVVNVRREPYDDDDPGVTDETDFSANQVQSGVLEDWVNGKLEDTLPGDIATARSLHSLRKISSSYNGNAVRIRRSSDNIEVDVAFDSDDKVSASSAITNIAEQGGESGSTTATTIGDFLNPTYTVGTSVESASRTFNSFTANGNTGFTGTKTGVGSSTGGFPYTFATGDVISVSFDLVIADSASPTFILSGNNMGSGSLGTGSTFTSSGSYTQELTATSGTGTHLAFTDGNTGTFTVSNFKVTSHKAEAFVHTWYNQSGASTGATQTTAQRQPKIATNGTLLDHILFEGSGTVSTPASTDQYLVDTSINFASALTLGCVSDRLDTTGNGMYPVSVCRQSAVNRFFGIQEAASQSIFITRNSTAVSHTVDNTSELKRFTIGRVGSDSETDAEISIFGRAFGNNNGADWGNIIGISNQNSFVIGALGLANDTGSVATNTATFQGKVYETFAYQTDEKDELFKIASNVNNYYDLYNDANDMATDWSDDPTAPYGSAFTSNGKDGYTIDYSAGVANTRARWQFANNVPSGEVIYYSFNASITSGTPAIILKQSDGTSNANSSSVAITSGFNTGSITTNAEAVYFAIGDSEGTQDYSISDFKVSRIARNGFVERLYDQSGNGNNARQSSASKQPYIIQNGGQCKMTNGNPAVMGARYSLNNNNFLEMDTGISDPYTMFSSMYTNRSFALLFGGSNVGSTPRMELNTNEIEVFLNATDDFATSTDNTVDSVVTLFSAENGGTAVLRKNGTQIDSLARVDDEERPMKFLFRHQNNSQNKGVFFDSFIVYGSDKTSDFTEIENNLKLANNIS